MNFKFRFTAKDHIKSDTQNHPLALEKINTSEEFRVDCNSGNLIVFSGSHLHGTVPNTSNKTRFSIDLRILLKNLHEQNIAANMDSKSTGSTITDFVKSTDLSNYTN